jgi:hypothetical protein
MQQTDNAWSWSESFTKALEGLMLEPTPDRAVRLDWSRHREQLGWWRRQVAAARERYRQGHAEALRALHEYWRIIADDVREQARIASETYRQVHFLESA